LPAAIPFRIAIRAAGVVTGLCLIYWLWTHELTPAATLLMGIGGVLLARWFSRQRLAPNPFGDAQRNFALRPVWSDLLKSGACFAATLIWAASGALAVRYHKLPDTEWVVYGLVGVPLIALLLGFTFFLGRAALRAMYGASSKTAP